MPSATLHKPGVLDTHSNRGGNSTHHRKTTGRPPARRGRLGRNQFTRDRSVNSGRGGGAETPKRSNSRDPAGRSSPFPSMHTGLNGISGESGRSSRPKYHHPHRTSMNEMKRRVAAILEFVNRMRDDSKESQSNSHGSSSGPSGSRTPKKGASNLDALYGTENNMPQNAALVKGVEAGLSSTSGDSSSPATNGNLGSMAINEGAFRNMGSTEIRQILRGELLTWQNLYGKYGER